jgi:hypothetical protein
LPLDFDGQFKDAPRRNRHSGAGRPVQGRLP